MSGFEIDGKRCAVFGASGELGSRLARALVADGASVGLAARERSDLADLAEELGAPSASFEASDPESCRAAVERLADELGGLDLVVVSVGVAGFGRAGDVGPDGIERLFAVNALGPIAICDAAIGRLGEGGALAVISAMVAEYPTAGLSHYSAAKAALSAYLQALGREQRRNKVSVLDVRPSHIDTGFAGESLFGEPPQMPSPLDADDVVREIIAALGDGRRALAWKPGAGTPASAQERERQA